MSKSSLFKETGQKHRHLTQSNAFGLLLVSFLLIKISTVIFLPNRHYSLASDLTPENILQAVNNQRSIRNLVLLNTNNPLTLAAQSKADDMIARKYFAHIDPDGHYIWDKIVADGYTPYTQLGENLAIEFYDTDSLMAAWMNSPEHRANILQEGFRDQGMGVSFGDVQQSQYYSSIANTFGAMAPAPKTQVLKTTPPAPVSAAKKPAAPLAPVQPKPKAAPVIQTTPVVQAPAPSSTQPIEVRGAALQNSTPASNVIAKPETQSPVPAPLPAATRQSASAIIGNDQGTTLNDYDVNRYLILISGVALLLLMLSDIRIALEKKLGGLDKKFNNLALLVISLVVIAFIYWL